MGFKVNASDFNRCTREIERMVQRNTAAYGQNLAREFESEAKSGAPWTDRRGSARGKLYGTSTASGGRVRVEMGGSAPNYKRGPLSASDYMEYLEFDHGGRFAVVFPTAEAIAEDVREHFGEAALEGKMRVKITRNRRELDKQRKAYLLNTVAGRFMLGEAMRYNQWLQERAVFNHR